MAVKNLSNNIQSLFSSSINLFSYKRAVEELVYNALDAESTSVAIRIHIEENKIQVVDNGNGIAKEDFKLLGQRYATSKFVDMSHFKSAPNSYGFRGQALASIVDVSKYVKITSRPNRTEETWTKTFYKGKEKESCETTVRPSKGTTIEIKYFLYNLKIQSKSIDQVNELNNIKMLLEQLSLVHSNVSFSLRDDAKNEIVFQVHKSRDIYQTFKSLYNIDKAGIQELQVEKGEYKAKAFIAKQYDHLNRHYYLFLNKKVVHNKKLHKGIQDGLKKYFHTSRTKIIKSKNTDHEHERDIHKNQIPFYFIFIICPYYDFEISNTPRQSTLEFKNWNQINKLMEKIVNFYTGGLRDYEIKLNQNTKVIANEENNDTRAKVREIMKKILGNSSKKPGVSQMQNGIKGKLIKRKKKKSKILLTKVLPTKCLQNVSLKRIINFDKNVRNEPITAEKISVSKIKETKPKPSEDRKHLTYQHNNKIKNKQSYHGVPKNKHRQVSISTIKDKKRKFRSDAFVKAFKNQTSTVERRCNLLAKEVDNLIPPHKRIKKLRVLVNETVNYNSIVKNDESISVRKRVKETIIHNYIPLKQDNCHCKNLNTNVKTSHDLVKPVLEYHENVTPPNNYLTLKDDNKGKNKVKLPHLTFQSHHYKNTSSDDKNLNNLCPINCCNKTQCLEETLAKTKTFKRLPQTITSTQHQQLQEIGHELRTKNTTNSKKNTFNFFNISSNITSYTIDFSDSKIGYDLTNKDTYSAINKNRTLDLMTIDNCPITCTVTTNIGLTYTLTESRSKTHTGNDNVRPNYDYTVHVTQDFTGKSVKEYNENNKLITNEKEYREDPLNIIFLSNSSTSVARENINEAIQPLNLCEVILESSNVREMSFDTNIRHNLYDSLINFASSEYFCTKNCENIENLAQNLMLTEIESPPSHTMEGPINNIVGQEITNFMPEICNNSKLNHVDKNNVTTNNEIFGQNVIHETAEMDNFNIINRPRFVPKGMSQIFKNNKNKNAISLRSNMDYYEQEIYNRFMDDVYMQTEIYEPMVVNANDITSKAIGKINNKLNKENSSLTFSTRSLKEATVLGQVDRKFIATIMKGESDSIDFLVLFDQHAVHERIRLEKNLADYHDGNSWKCVKLDDVILKLPKDDILYLHNYKDKFTQFGLQWTVLNNHELTLHAVPKAILGKNARQAEKVINAVKNLILEQVDIIKAQKGCAYLYPKSIMDLVFSEACRYAIMFGDSLSKRDCLELIRSLSSCKTPFQCAHGRPVMAVIMEVKNEKRNYKINMDKLRNFRTPNNNNK